MSVRAVSWAYGLNLIQVETELSERAEDVQTAYTGRSVRS